ncbi:hypothetical protein SBADM41S_07910 [Streptomyces badius]
MAVTASIRPRASTYPLINDMVAVATVRSRSQDPATISTLIACGCRASWSARDSRACGTHDTSIRARAP